MQQRGLDVMGRLTSTLLQFYCWYCFERICKIVQHLAKICENWLPQAPCTWAPSCWKMNNSLDRLSDIWRAGSVVTVSRYDLILLANLDSVIDKYQTGVISTTCDSPTDAISNRTSVRRGFATTSDRCACSQLFCACSSVVTVHIFSSVNKVVLTSLSEHIWATVFDGRVLHGSSLHSALLHCDFWAQTFHQVV